MDNMKFEEQTFINFDSKVLSISLEEEAQDLELSGFTTAGSFSSAGSFVGSCASSGSSISSAGN